MGTVVTYAPGEARSACNHEQATRERIARQLAALLGYDFKGEYDASIDYRGEHLFFVPAQTIVGVQAARALGVTRPRDFFGGVVPHEFVATKSITHPLVAHDARAPRGWSAGFTAAVAGVVLRGYTAFCAADARRGGARLLEGGSVRVKPAIAVGGRGQSVVTSVRELDDAVADIAERDLAQCGVTVEENLTEVTTYSVGCVILDTAVVTYFGTQKLTADHKGADVYGGSDLTVARGGFDELLKLPLPESARRAVEQARVYDAAADRHFEGFMASRRNYDIAVGIRGATERRGGVLEQSWRIGGASGAEVAALEWFHTHPGARAVNASCFEVYGDAAPPAGATVYFDGEDENVGRILKYTVVEPYVDA